MRRRKTVNISRFKTSRRQSEENNALAPHPSVLYGWKHDIENQISAKNECISPSQNIKENLKDIYFLAVEFINREDILCITDVL